MCCAGQCPNCIVAVDSGSAAGRGPCTEPVRRGSRSSTSTVRWSLEVDPMRATDLVAGKLTHARLLLQAVHPAAQAVAGSTRRCWRNAAGLGKLRQERARAEVADRVSPPPRLRDGGGRRNRLAARGGVRCAAGRRASILAGRGPGAGRSAADGADRRRIEDLVAAAQTAGVELLGARQRPGLLRRPGPGLGRTTPCTRSAPLATSSPPARSPERPLVFAGNDFPV